ncbi:hypothetical protein GOBAR_DD04379 [Gossypium barbadense]|nr:hypothetical protein GOBAR_DD04379 [Gossypium barbadense]
MDNKKPGNDGTADEVTRESLIAISYSLPDKVAAASKLSSDNSNREKLFERKGSDGDEKSVVHFGFDQTANFSVEVD